MSQTPKVLIINAETGEEELRDMNAKELAQFSLDQAQAEAAEQAALDLAALKSSAKAKLIAGEPLTGAEADTLVI